MVSEVTRCQKHLIAREMLAINDFLSIQPLAKGMQFSADSSMLAVGLQGRKGSAVIHFLKFQSCF